MEYIIYTINYIMYSQYVYNDVSETDVFLLKMTMKLHDII